MTLPIRESPTREQSRIASSMQSSKLGRAYCLVCGAPLGPELLHVGPPTLMGRIYAAAP